jgi:hypothetical protein
MIRQVRQKFKAPSVVKRKRRLLAESLEQRNLLATLTVTPSVSTIFEDNIGPNRPSMVQFTVKLSEPPSVARPNGYEYGPPADTLLKITGQVDAYELDFYTDPSVPPTPTPDYREFRPYYKDLFAISSTQDEERPVSAIVPGASNSVDTLDYESDPLTVTVQVAYYPYIGDDGWGYPIFSQTLQSISTDVSLTIMDGDVAPLNKAATLVNADATATEPHHVHYREVAADTGTLLMAFPTEWNGGDITLAISGPGTGVATYLQDYTINLRAEPAGKTVTLQSMVSGGYKLSVPAGVTQVYLDVVPQGDIREPAPVNGEPASETATISVSPSNQIFSGTNNTTITVSGTGTVTINDVLENLALVAEGGATEEYRSEADYGAFKITPAPPVSGLKMRGNAFLRIDATASNSAIPGNHPSTLGTTVPGADYYLRRRDTGAWIVINPVPGSPGVF